MSEYIRTFIALDVSFRAKEELSRIISELKKTDANVKWVDPFSVHLTLKFLGSTSQKKIESVHERLQSIAASTKPFDIEISSLGAFSSLDHIKVIWAGVSLGKEETTSLAEEVNLAMHLEGFDKEKRPFSPHLTLGRVKSTKNMSKLKDTIKVLKVNPVKICINSIIFFKSELTPEKAVYSPIYTLNLKN